MRYIFGGAIAMFLCWAFIYAPIYGWHYVFSEGEHTGYVTAVSTHGIFFKTHNAYIKTDTQSSQEDKYCVIGDEVFENLRTLSVEKAKVTVKFMSWFVDGAKYCEGGNVGIITGIKE